MPLSPTETVRAILRQRFAPPEWVLLEELAPRTGGGTGYADAVAMNLWKSRGYAVCGIEIKVHRGDWLRELKRPAKAEDVFRYCNTWTVVALPGVVEPSEVPVTWGLTEVQRGRLVEVVKAPALAPDPLDRPFVASLMRRGFAQIDKLVELRQRQTIADMQTQIEAQITAEVERRTHRYEDLKKAVEKWEAATGLTFGRYGGPAITTIQLAQHLERLRFQFADNGPDTGFAFLGTLADNLQRASQVVREALSTTGADETMATGKEGGDS